MFYQYRKLVENEFIVVGGDCSQGGEDYNVCQFVSKTHLDVPIMYRSRGVAATMTASIAPALEAVYNQTKVKPIIALERNNGGASEMERLQALNRNQKYTTYIMKRIGLVDSTDTNKLGYDTNTATRPILLGDLKDCIDNNQLHVYSEETINEMYSFIVKNGKPQAEEGAHDDTIMALAIAWQLYQTETPQVSHVSLEFPDDTQELFNGGFY